MPQIFLSYRRADSQSSADRIYDRLVQEFPKATIFKDVDSIPLGADFRRVLEQSVLGADVFIAIMGPGWLNATDENGNRRLDNPDDFVRVELETAFKHGKIVIPVTVANATLPSAAELPAQLKELVFRQGQAVRHDPDFHTDMARLIGSLHELFGTSSAAQRSSENAASDDFVEVLKHRAELVSAYILEQRRSALFDADRHHGSSDTRHDIERRYDLAIESFHILHAQYLDALSAGKPQMAHEIIGNLYQLVYKCRYKRSDDPPPMLAAASRYD